MVFTWDPYLAWHKKSCFRRARTSSITRVYRLRISYRGQPCWRDPNRGAFILPTLIRTEDSSAHAQVHNVEVFGPVASVISYDGTAADVSRMISYGQGCLVTAVYGDNRSFLAECIAESAAWNGRLVLTDAKIAAKSYAPGMVLPHLLHGGPGRAGGGEELGGTRGLRIYQQRTAIQGNGPLIAKLLNAD